MLGFPSRVVLGLLCLYITSTSEPVIHLWQDSRRLMALQLVIGTDSFSRKKEELFLQLGWKELCFLYV